jgi:hypothetical protein
MVAMIVSLSATGQKQAVDVSKMVVKGGKGKPVPQSCGGNPQVIGGYRSPLFCQGLKYPGIKFRDFLIDIENLDPGRIKELIELTAILRSPASTTKTCQQFAKNHSAYADMFCLPQQIHGRSLVSLESDIKIGIDQDPLHPADPPFTCK